MFSVLFQLHPKPDQWDAYLGYAKLLKPELEQMEGFIEAFPLLHRETTRCSYAESLLAPRAFSEMNWKVGVSEL